MLLSSDILSAQPKLMHMSIATLPELVLNEKALDAFYELRSMDDNLVYWKLQ